ncbi:MAG: ABC transporter ATP-binding protein [Muribaculaceae bacterium]|nr:ABC transporter ATP-binding protein [Muribaculaceae bacterium]
MVKIENLSYSYGKSKKPVFKDFSLNLESGNVYGLLGKNGAGKSTLLYLISGLLIPVSGGVIIKGKDARKRLPETLCDIFLVPEEFDLPDVKLSSYVKTYAPFYPKFSEEDMVRCLNVFGIEGDVNLGTLSLGQKKKVFMSFALATNTSLLLMDEPTNGLDIPGKSQFRKFIASGMNENRIILISTHQVKDIDKIIDRVLILDDCGIIINAGMDKVTEKLLFVESADPELLSSAIYAQNSLAGSSLVLENKYNEESEVNLETLFIAAHENREKIKDLFTSK